MIKFEGEIRFRCTGPDSDNYRGRVIEDTLKSLQQEGMLEYETFGSRGENVFDFREKDPHGKLRPKKKYTTLGYIVRKPKR